MPIWNSHTLSLPLSFTSNLLKSTHLYNNQYIWKFYCKLLYSFLKGRNVGHINKSLNPFSSMKSSASLEPITDVICTWIICLISVLYGIYMYTCPASQGSSYIFKWHLRLLDSWMQGWWGRYSSCPSYKHSPFVLS